MFLPIFQYNLSTVVVSKTDEYVRFIAQKATPRALSTLENEQASDLEEELSNVSECVLTEQWHQIQLSFIGKLIQPGTRIIIPSSFRKIVLHLAHESHPGIVYAMRRLQT